MATWGLGAAERPGYREFPDNMVAAFEYADGRVLLYEDHLFTPYGLHGVDSGNAFYGTVAT